MPERSLQATRGQLGEDLAADYCQRRLGMRIITRNWRCKRGELDIIAMDGPVLVFIEVRARDEDALVSGYHSIRAHKKKVLLRACKTYLYQLQNAPKHVRFDVVDISLSSIGEDRIHHYSNVPLFTKYYTPER
jgi:putative endonuclease